MANGVIYILTNPSFPEYVKIGYADDVDKRLTELNRSECIPFAFRIYATYEVSGRLKDLKLHDMIDRLNPNLRSIEEFNGKKRVREFYNMKPKEAFAILETIAKINGLEDKLKLYELSAEAEEDREIAEENRAINSSRHHFKKIKFRSSITNKEYISGTNDNGTLKIVEVDSGNEVLNYSTPSKKQIVGRALEDLGEHVEKDETTYQRMHRLEKIILKSR